MPKSKKEKDYNRYHIEEILDTISERKESNWGKFLVRASLDDNPSTVDLRNLCIKEDGTYKIGKGISLNNMEADKATDALVSHGFGTYEVLQKECDRRKRIFYDDGKKDDA